MNIKIRLFFVLFLLSGMQNTLAQSCGLQPGDGCPNTDYSNFGLNSNNNPASIEYDNFVSTFHSSIIRNNNGDFIAWGEGMASIDNSGGSATTRNLLTPTLLNSTWDADLTGKRILKVAGSSGGAGNVQFVALTTDGLYAWGTHNFLIQTTLLGGNNTNTGFRKVGPTNGNNFSLPPGLVPSDVKMLTAGGGINFSLVLTTCSGQVWVLSNNIHARGNGSLANDAISTGNPGPITWSQVQTSVGVPLTGIIAARVRNNGIIALKNDNTIWTWGTNTYLGNGTAVAASRGFATQMTHPNTSETIKMVGITNEGSINSKTYYVLMTNGKLYSLGANNRKQLGNWGTTESTVWVQPRYTSSAGPVMNNIAWISPQEHELGFAAINVITNTGQLYAWGQNSQGMLGFPAATLTADPGIPDGILSTDKILAVKTGGHTTMVVKECTPNLGYVGHKQYGSMGDGVLASFDITSYTFSNTPMLSLCGTVPVTVTSTTAANANGTYCLNTPITLVGTPSGGVFTVVSGSATVSGNQVTLTGPGVTVVNYAVTLACGTISSTNYNLTAGFCDVDTDGDGIIDSIDIDDDNDGVLDTQEGICYDSNVGPSAFGDLPGSAWGTGYGTIFFFNDLTNFSSTNNLFANPNLIALIPSNCNITANGSATITNVNSTTLAQAKSTDEYLGINFTTKNNVFNASIDYFYFFRSVASNYNMTFSISSDNINFTDLATTTYSTPTGSYPAHTQTVDFPNYPLAPNTTYYIRIYMYGLSSGTTSYIDDVGLAFDWCEDIFTDSDLISNRIDLDSDNDACSDAIEAGSSTTAASTTVYPTDTDTNGNGFLNLYEGATAGTINYTSTYNTFALNQSSDNCYSLPIELVDFSSMCFRDHVHIEWSTASEINNDYFTIEYSEDGINWVVLDKIDGSGNSNALINYSYNDYSIKFSETYYYRLSQTDYDGAQETFNVISQNCALQELTVFPNPADDELFILGISSGDQFTVTNTLGQTIVKFDVTGSSYNLLLKNFSAGVYYIVQNTDEHQVIKKFTKK